MEYDALGARMTTLTTLLWETGLIGALMPLIFYIFNFYDALHLRKSPDIRGDLALAWIGIITMIAISYVYKNLLFHNISFIFWYFSGYIA